MSTRQSISFPTQRDDIFKDAHLPCTVCGTGLEIRLSHKGKPYCVCDGCGIQIFFRGKTGIHRLRELLKANTLIVGKESITDRALVLYNRILQLRGRKKQLEDKRGLFATDEALEIAIQAIDREIEMLQGRLEELANDPSVKDE